MSRLTIDLTSDQHKTLKAVAALQGKTIKQYSLEKLFPVSVASEADQAWDELKTLLVERVSRAEKHGFSDQTVADIFDTVLSEDEAA